MTAMRKPIMSGSLSWSAFSNSVLLCVLLLHISSAFSPHSYTFSPLPHNHRNQLTSTPARKTTRIATSLASNASPLASLNSFVDELPLPDQLRDSLRYFVSEYLTATGPEGGCLDGEEAVERIKGCIELGLKHGIQAPYQFPPAHKAIRSPFDYYDFGCKFFEPCMDLANSHLSGSSNLDDVFAAISRGENVVFLANHQSEADPQVVSLLIQRFSSHGDKTPDITYVAGHKVTTDPLAVPFSMGRNLLCIHSKKHIDVDPETKPAKQKQNLATMASMLSLMKAGGLCLWVAPSGGRDRINTSSKEIPPAEFDSKTIDMFRLMARKSKVPTHFHTMSMVSYELCPPPEEVVADVGERRNIRFSPIGIHIGKEVDNEGGLEGRHKFTERAMEQMEEEYWELRAKVFPGGQGGRKK